VDHDGNGWVECARGHRHWGLHGAAGLLLHTVDDAGAARVLLQHRAAWSHHGGTWGVPGGARDSHEDAVAAALREATEEAGLDRSRVRTRHTFVDDHGGWSYTTVYADTPHPLPTELNQESIELDWVGLSDVASRDLHPCLLYTSPSPRDRTRSRMPSSA
jgi:8-oxo-dGTP pyrophosphatase MutT (NUDIX family)